MNVTGHPSQQQSRHPSLATIQQAARCLVRPSTDAVTRASASAFLERWTTVAATRRSPVDHENSAAAVADDAVVWTRYAQWIHSFTASVAGAAEEEPAVPLLCLQMLLRRIRSAVRTSSPSSNEQHCLETVHGALEEFLQQSQASRDTAQQTEQQHHANNTHVSDPVMALACRCVAALAVRVTGGLSHWAGRTTTAIVAAASSSSSSSHSSNILLLFLRLLTYLALEADAVSDRSSAQTAALLAPQCGATLDCLARILLLLDNNRGHNHDDAILLPQPQCRWGQAAAAALEAWVQVAHLTTTQLSTVVVTINNTTITTAPAAAVPLLPHCISLLSSYPLQTETTTTGSTSSSNGNQLLIRHMAQALQTAVDQDEDSDRAALALLQCVPPEGWHVSHLTNNDDALVARATLVCTLVTHALENLVGQSWQQQSRTDSSNPSLSALAVVLVPQLLDWQGRRRVGQSGDGACAWSLRILVLDVWLAVADVPIQERHATWRGPLWGEIVAAIWASSQVSSEDDNDDTHERREYRRLSVDILGAAYGLLRSDYIQFNVEHICGVGTFGPSSKSANAEAALFCLTAVAKDVNKRTAARKSSILTAKEVNDPQRTVELLVRTVQHIHTLGVRHHLSAVALTQFPQPLSISEVALHVGVVEFLGAYAVTWSGHCSMQDLCGLVSHVAQNLYLEPSLLINADSYTDDAPLLLLESAKSIRSLLVACGSSFASASSLDQQESLQVCLRHAMASILSPNMVHSECMVVVTEGCVRLIMQTGNLEVIQHFMMQEIVQPAMQKANVALELIGGPTVPLSESVFKGSKEMARCLHVLQTVLRFSEARNDEKGTTISSILGTVLPWLELVAIQATHCEAVFDKIISIHEQVLRNASYIAKQSFQQTIKYVISVFEKSTHAKCLHYIAGAVELYGASETAYFATVLSHVSELVFGSLQQNGPDASSLLIQSFFEMNQRYLLFCSSALVHSLHFQAIISCAVESLSACKGERDATRSVINFLTQIFGWPNLRLSPDQLHILQANQNVLNEQLVMHGARTIHLCVDILLSGSQALHPASIDCLFAVLSAAINLPVCSEYQSNMAREWIECAMNTTSNMQSVSIERSVALLVNFARRGSKSKPHAKMLLFDICLIHQGERSEEALLNYKM